MLKKTHKKQETKAKYQQSIQIFRYQVCCLFLFTIIVVVYISDESEDYKQWITDLYLEGDF